MARKDIFTNGQAYLQGEIEMIVLKLSSERRSRLFNLHVKKSLFWKCSIES